MLDTHTQVEAPRPPENPFKAHSRGHSGSPTMPLESATYIHDLVAANPVHTDGLNQADAHLRLLKTVLQSTFPNLTAAVTAAPADLNATAGLVNATTGTLSVPVPTSSTT